MKKSSQPIYNKRYLKKISRAHSTSVSLDAAASDHTVVPKVENDELIQMLYAMHGPGMRPPTDAYRRPIHNRNEYVMFINGRRVRK